jgi:WD40 repeat protein
VWRDSLFTGSLDRTIRQWSLASGECVGVVQRHGAAVRALLMVGDSLLSASSDFTIVEWDLSECAGGSEEFTQLRTLVGHKDGVFALCEHDGVLYSGSADRTCKRWNLRSGAVTQVRPCAASAARRAVRGPLSREWSARARRRSDARADARRHGPRRASSTGRSTHREIRSRPSRSSSSCCCTRRCERRCPF